MANEGLGWESLLKMVHNPGGDWNPGWGVDLKYREVFQQNLDLRPENASRVFKQKLPSDGAYL